MQKFCTNISTRIVNFTTSTDKVEVTSLCGTKIETMLSQTSVDTGTKQGKHTQKEYRLVHILPYLL